MSVRWMCAVMMSLCLGTAGMATEKSTPPAPEAAPTEIIITPEQLSETALAAMQNLLAGKDGIESKLELVRAPNPIKIKPGEYSVQAEVGNNMVQAGLRAVRVTITRKNQLLTSTEVTLRIRLFQNLPVAAHSVGMNQTMGAEDVVFESRELKPNMGKLADPNALSGMRLRVPVQQGQILEDRLFQPLPVIKKGDRVMITINRGSLFISTNAESQGEAGIGQNVRVKFLDTGAELYVKASGPGRAEM